ncbi:MAG: DNA internalization-related competence protein ComEC/Rec2 [Rhodocyclales bacterium GWA2_65_19]|nr:MAG: DNA internalization-related competence protein ComEC/Rec2 [Rhodocyclales bacterium GWA2_65_19]
MRLFVLAFACGVWLLQQQAELPAAPWLVGLTSGALLGLALQSGLQESALVVRRSVAVATLVAAGAALGFVWAASLAHLRLAHELPAAMEGTDIELAGVVAGLPQALERGVRFEFDVEQAVPGVPPHISLAWYRTPDTADDDVSPLIPVRAGERWRFTVRLKRPHGNFNPRGFDYEAWLFERNIRATGYVRPRSAERIDARVWRPAYMVEMLRENIRDRFRAALPDEAYAGILVALAVGDQQAIDAELWQTFARTGITHLMSISGLHITMFAGLAYALISWLWRRSARLPLRLPAQHAAAAGGFLAALFYCLLAGFAVPAQRTLYMLGVVAVARLSGREMAASRVLLLALLLVLLLDPWAVLAAGFWLSFGAVALLFHIGSGRLGPAHWMVEWGRAQWAVTLGMLPALLALFQQFSVVSPLANAVAIPVVSFVITPLVLIGALPLLDPLLSLAHLITAWLMAFIDWLAALPLAMWQQAAPPAWSVLLALAGGVWLLLPRGFPARWLGLLAFLPLLTVVPPRPGPGAAEVTVLDVGQGLAIHVQTATHDLLFDAGPAFSADADSGNRIISPYLRALGVRRLDVLVVSHADKDHEGGAVSVLAALPVALLKTSLPFEHALSAQPVAHELCQDGDAWNWDGVRFEMLHPGTEPLSRKTNDVSCVLRITAAGRSLLLSSDIEAVSERALLVGHRAELAAEAMTVPHHGSKTSSTPEFIAAVGARDVIFPVGYRNRFGHPKDEVVARYVQSGARLHRTDSDGAVRVGLGSAAVTFSHEREERRRYWHARHARHARQIELDR